MNTMAPQLKAAGVALPPLKFRIWNWLKDHPEKTCLEIKAGLGISYEPGQALIELERGGVVKVYSGVNRLTNYKIKRYSVVNSKEFVNVTLGDIAAMKPKAPVLASVPQTVHKEAVPTAKADAPQVITMANLDNLTIGEARALYMKLKEMFS